VPARITCWAASCGVEVCDATGCEAADWDWARPASHDTRPQPSNGQRERGRPAEAQQVDRRQAAERDPAGLVRGADEAADGEGRQHREGQRRAGAGLVQRARAAAVGQLHRGAEQEGAEHQADRQRRHRADELARVAREQRQGERGGEHQQQHLRPQALRVAALDVVAPAGGEAEARALQRGAEADAEQREQALAHARGEHHREHAGEAAADQ